MSWDEAEFRRRLLSLVQYGEITEQVEGGRYMVQVDDDDHDEKPSIVGPFAKMSLSGEGESYNAPIAIKSQVALLCPNGDLSMAFILGVIPKDSVLKDKTFDAPELIYSDGTSFKYEKSSKTLTVKVADGGKLNVKVLDGAVTIESPSLEFKGNTTISGTLTVTEAASLKSGLDVTGSVTASADIEAQNMKAKIDVKAGAVSLISHTHSGGTANGFTGSPVA